MTLRRILACGSLLAALSAISVPAFAQDKKEPAAPAAKTAGHMMGASKMHRRGHRMMGRKKHSMRHGKMHSRMMHKK